MAGIIAGSLALIGDAVHNGSDVGALIIALIARRWSRREPDSRRTYGYRRASIIGAMVNVTILIIIGIYLLYESAMRINDPVNIDGWIMIVVASIALMVDLGTVLLMRLMGKDLNIRAALAHNLADAMASVGSHCGGRNHSDFELYLGRPNTNWNYRNLYFNTIRNNAKAVYCHLD